MFKNASLLTKKCPRCNGRGWVDGASDLDSFVCDLCNAKPEIRLPTGDLVYRAMIARSEQIKRDDQSE